MAATETPVNTPEAWSVRATMFERPWQAARWSEHGQRERHALVVDALQPRPGDRLLDYGCGTGALTGHLPAGVVYVGFDWADGMIDRAREDHSGYTFTAVEPTGRFDLVAVVGTFNLSHRWSKQRTFHTLRHLWDATGCRTLAASLYAGTDDRCLIYTVEELEACGRSLTWDARAVRIRHNDLLLVARRSRKGER